MMASKRGATSNCGPEQAKNRLDVAKQYQELAHLKAKEKLGAARNVAAGNAVLAGIAASDAICCWNLGERSSSSSHSDAVVLLAKLDKKLAKHLSILIGDKTTSHYGEKFIGVETLKSCLRAMDQLVLSASKIVVGL